MRIGALYVHGDGYRSIAKQLNAECAPAPTPRRTRGDGRPAGWSPSTVRDVLLRPDYRGELLWGRVRKRDPWGKRKRALQPPDDWERVKAPYLRIFPAEMAVAIDARLRDQRAIYLRGTGGRLQSKPASSASSAFLLTGLATCAVCGGSFGVRLAGGRSRRRVYKCLVNHTRGPAVCSNGLAVSLAATDHAVLSVVESVVLRPEVIVASLNEAVRRLRPADQPNAERQRLQAALAQTERELRNLVQAVAAGGETATLVEAVKQRERDRARVQRELASLDALAAVGSTDSVDLQRRLEHHLANWRGLLQRHIQQARQIVSKLLRERLVFTPRTDPNTGARYYEFAGVGRMEPLLSGVLPIPKALVTPAGFEPAISTLKGSRPGPG